MIRLSEDGKTIVNLNNWDEVFERPGFKQNIDKGKINLKHIIGSYEKEPCGLKDCRTPHKRGYLVVCEGGIETNIGNKCGKREFGVDFTNMEKKFKRDINAIAFREAIQTAIFQVENFRAEIAKILKNGGNKAFGSMRDLATTNNIFSAPIRLGLKKRALKKDVNIVLKREATKEEVEDIEAIERRKIDYSKDNPVYIEIGSERIIGLSAFVDYAKIKSVLVQDVPVMLSQLEMLEPDKLNYSELQRWNKLINQLDRQFREVREIIEDCQRFVRTDNIQIIKTFAEII